MKQLPKSLWKYFWEVKPEKVDVENRPEYVISRLMDYGHTEDVKWMRKTYGDELIRHTLRTTRGINRASASYWAMITNVQPGEVKCLQTPYRQIPYGV